MPGKMPMEQKVHLLSGSGWGSADLQTEAVAGLAADKERTVQAVARKRIFFIVIYPFCYITESEVVVEKDAPGEGAIFDKVEQSELNGLISGCVDDADLETGAGLNEVDDGELQAIDRLGFTVNERALNAVDFFAAGVKDGSFHTPNGCADGDGCADLDTVNGIREHIRRGAGKEAHLEDGPVIGISILGLCCSGVCGREGADAKGCDQGEKKFFHEDLLFLIRGNWGKYRQEGVVFNKKAQKRAKMRKIFKKELDKIKKCGMLYSMMQPVRVEKPER